MMNKRITAPLLALYLLLSLLPIYWMLTSSPP
jgi:glycerol transport system permease protein